MVDTLLMYLMVELLFPVRHYFVIISYMHDYSPFTFVFTSTTQYLFVPLLYYSATTLYTSSNNSKFNLNLITPTVILVTLLLVADQAPALVQPGSAPS